MNVSTRQRYVKSHRLLGSWATLVIVWVVLSGWILNHSQRLGLDQVQISSAILLNWYGMTPEGELHAFTLADHWLTELDHTVFLNGEPIITLNAPLLGAVQLEEFVAFGSEQEIVLGILDQKLEIVDRLQRDALPGPIIRVGVRENKELLIETQGGIFRANGDFIRWSPVDADLAMNGTNWSNPQKAPEDLRDTVLKNYRGEGVSLSRLITDLHTGRLFGGFGFLLTDLAAIVILVLTITGFINGLTRKR